MYPLLARRSHLAVYLLLWLLMGVLLAAVLALQGGLPWTGAFGAGLPLAVAYSFICLSAWYVARSMPLAGTGAIRVVATAFGAAVLSSAMWLVLGRGWLALIATRWPAQGERTFAATQTLLFGTGILLYLLALAVSYVLVVFEASQDALAARAAGAGAGPRGRAAVAARADRSALPVQQPAFDQRADHGRPAGGAADVPAARRFSAARRVALGGADRITLSREVALIENFLAIERVRFGDRLSVVVDAGDAGDCLVPPLLLQPLVENAVTHGIAHLLEGGTVRVTAARDGRLAADRGRESVRSGPAEARRAPGWGWRTSAPGCARSTAATRRCVAEERGERWRVELALPATVGEKRHDRRDALRVVIVDDEPLARAVVREYLKHHAGRRSGGRVRQRVRCGEGGQPSCRRI